MLRPVSASTHQMPAPFFFFNDTATTEIYTLSLHDALPICDAARVCRARSAVAGARRSDPRRSHGRAALAIVDLSDRHRCPGAGCAEPRVVRGPGVARGGCGEPDGRPWGGGGS